MSRNLLRLFSLFALAAVIGLVAAYSVGAQDPEPLPGPKDYAESVCRGNLSCTGYKGDDAKACGANAVCVGVKNPIPLFNTCIPSKANPKCTTDDSKYPTVICPGLCVGDATKTCSIKNIGCK